MPSLATAAAAMGFAILFGLRPGDWRLWLLGLTMLLAQFSISALNDWADRERDAQAGRIRPLPMQLLSPFGALGIAAGCAALAIALAGSRGAASLALVGLGITAGWLYDLGFKLTPLSFVPFAVGFPLLPIWAATVAGRPATSLGWLFIAGAPLATAIHLGDAIPDRELDAAARARTFAVVLGRPGAELTAALALVAGGCLLGGGVFAHHRAGALAIAALGLAAAAGYLWLVTRDPEWRDLGRWVIAGGALLVAVPGLALS